MMETTTYLSDSRYHPWAIFSGSTMSEAQLEDEIYDDPLSRSYDHSSQIQDVTMVVSCDIEGAKSDQDRICDPKRIFWRQESPKDWSLHKRNNFIIYQGLEDYSGFHVDAVATMLLSTGILPHNENSMRGTFAPKFERDVIFTKRFEFKTFELPRWRPSVIIGKKAIEENDAQ